MYYRNCGRIIMILWTVGILGCNNHTFVELRVRDSVTKEPLKLGTLEYKYDLWVPALFPPVYLSEEGWGSGVHDGTAELYLQSNTNIMIELYDAVGYPRTVAKLVAPQNLKDFKPTPWKKGQVAGPATTAQPARILEFQLAPRQQSANPRPTQDNCNDHRGETKMPAR